MASPMQSATTPLRSDLSPGEISIRDLAIPALLALFQLILQMTFHGNYGYFRDELYYIACSDHLAWGYVDLPPLSIVLLRVSRWLLGDSLQALRFFPSVAGAGVVILAALMARGLGGGKLAQWLAAACVVAAHGLIGHGELFTMNSFDVLFWAAAGYVVITILASEKPRLWLLFGAIVGLGLMNKYSMGFMVIGLVAGLLFTRHRKHLASPWFWAGAGLAGLIFMPHVLWEFANGFPSLEFMRNASQNKNVSLGPLAFFAGQVRDMNVINAPLWLGAIYFFFSHDSGRYRPLGWLYPIVFVVMVLSSAKVYYLSAIYPIMLAGGSVMFEKFTARRPFRWLRPAYVSALAIVALIALPLCLPVLPVDTFISYQSAIGLTPRADENSALGELPQYYADQFGWQEWVDSVAVVFRQLTPQEQSECVIYVRNYGEAAAIDFFGKKYGLPHALCAHNSYWYWGPGEKTGNTAIIVGAGRTLDANLADLQRAYREVTLGGTTFARYAMPFENGRMLFVCKGMRTTFQNIWASERFFI